MAGGAEVGLGGDHPTFPSDRDRYLGAAVAVEAHLVAIDGVGLLRSQRLDGAGSPWDDEIDAEGVLLGAGRLEVGEGAVGAGRQLGKLHRPAALGVSGRVEVGELPEVPGATIRWSSRSCSSS